MHTSDSQQHTRIDRLSLYALLALICASFIILANMFMLVVRDARDRVVEQAAELVPASVADVAQIAGADTLALESSIAAHIERTPGLISLGIVYQKEGGAQYVAVHDLLLTAGAPAFATPVTTAAQALPHQVVTGATDTGYRESVYAFTATATSSAGYVRAVLDPTLMEMPIERNMVRIVLLTLALLGLVFFVTAWLLGTGKHRTTQRHLARTLAHTRTFLSQTLHEIQTPVTVIAGYAHMLSTETVPDTVRGQVERMVKAADTLSRFIDQAVLAHEIEHGEVPIRITALRPQQVVHAAITAVEKKHAGRKPCISHTSTGTQSMHADARVLGVVLEQLLDNALVHATSPIHVDVSTEGSDVCIRITDSGPGIETEVLRALQEKWNRTQPAQGLRGSGLGLWIAQELTKRMGGRLELTSSPRAGTVALIRMPRVIS
ncbi:MAG: hypothetical protein RL150_438 [Candidatus Parcubacteria bacterium]|jgi:signal transduction histidine kinase